MGTVSREGGAKEPYLKRNRLKIERRQLDLCVESRPISAMKESH